MIIGQSRTLFTKADTTPGRTLLNRSLIVLSLVVFLIAILWLDRGGMVDHSDHDVSLIDIIYFTMITITTVGYGDIVPVTDRARLIDALLITPVRIFIWILFLGTAYQLVIQKLWEDFRMSNLKKHLTNHIIICGYGRTGRIAAKELVAKGHPPEQIVAIDGSAHALQDAAESGFVALHGDAARESMIRKANITSAQTVIVSPGRDDTNVLVVLTVRQLNPSVRIISSAKEEENIKLIKQSGADTIISPSVVGGLMLADAVDRSHTADYLYDLMTAGGRVDLRERLVEREEVGKSSSSIQDGVVVRIIRGQTKIGIGELEGIPLQQGDVLLLISRNRKKENGNTKT